MNCEKCNHTGLLPFVKPDGSVSRFARIFCECHQDDHEYHPRLKTDDWDFPMSYGVYRSLCQYYGWDDPGPDRPSEPEEPKEQVIIHRHSNMGKKEYDLLQQTALKANHLNKKLTEHLEFKKKPQPVKSGKRGMKID